MGLDEIKKMKSELKKKIEEVGKRELALEFREFFEKNPEVDSIRWTQYTPYFNDGDPCEFSVHDFTVKMKVKAGDQEPDGDEDDDEDDGYLYPWGSKVGSEIITAVKELREKVCDEDVLLAVFDDHVQVTATREGFDVDDYSHD